MRDDLLLRVVDFTSSGDCRFVYFAIDKRTDLTLYTCPSINLQ